MSTCCTNTYDLGCVNACGTITVFAATQTGAHTLKWSSGGGPDVTDTQIYSALNNITYTMDGSILQVGYTYILSITNPDGTEYTYTEDGTEYDCFKIKIENTISA